MQHFEMHIQNVSIVKFEIFFCAEIFNANLQL